MPWLKRCIMRISVVLLVQFCFMSCVDITEAFTSAYNEEKIIEKGQNLAVPSLITSIDQHTAVKVLAERQSKKERSASFQSSEVSSLPETDIFKRKEALKDPKRQISNYGDAYFTGAFREWISPREDGADSGYQKLLSLRRWLANDLGYHTDDIDLRYVADAVWLLMTTRHGVAYKKTQVSKFYRDNKKDIQSFLRRHFVKIQEMKRFETESFIRTHRGELKDEVMKSIRINRRYRHFDIDDSPTGWDKAYGHFMDMADSVLSKETLQFSNRDSNESLLSGRVDVMDDIVWPLSDFRLQKDMLQNDDQDKEVVRQQMKDLMTLFRFSGKKEPLRGPEATQEEARHAYQDHQVANALYQMFSDFQDHMTYREGEQDLLAQGSNAKTISSTPLRELWKTRYAAYSEGEHFKLKPEFLDNFITRQGLDADSFSNITLGTFRLAKKFIATSAQIEVMQYPNYIYDRKARFGSIFNIILKVTIYGALFMGIILISFATQYAIFFLFISLTCLLVIGSLKSMWLIFKTSDSYSSIGQKIFSVVLVLGAVALVLGLILFGQSVLMTALSFLGLSPLVIVASYFLVGLTFRVGTAIVAHYYGDDYKLGKRDFIEFMKGHVQEPVRELEVNSSGIDRNRVYGQYLADMAILGRMTSQIYVKPELRHAAQGGDLPINYTAATLAMMYDKIKERSLNISTFKSDRYRQTDINMKAMVDELYDERMRILQDGEGGGDSLLSQFTNFECGMDLREYGIVHMFKMYHDTEILNNEMVTGAKDQAPSHSLNRGIEEVNSAVKKVKESTYYKSHQATLDEVIVLLTSDDPPKLEAIESLENLQKSGSSIKDLGNFRENVISWLQIIAVTHKRNQLLVEKFDRQRLDNYGTEQRLKVAEDFWSWATDKETGEGLDLLALFEGPNKKVIVLSGDTDAESYSSSDPSWVDKIKNKTVVIFEDETKGLTKNKKMVRVVLPKHFKKNWENYVQQKKKIQGKDQNPQTPQEVFEFNQDIQLFQKYRQQILNDLINNMENNSTAVHDMLLHGDHSYGFLTDLKHWQDMQQLFEYMHRKRLPQSNAIRKKIEMFHQSSSSYIASDVNRVLQEMLRDISTEQLIDFLEQEASRYSEAPFISLTLKQTCENLKSKKFKPENQSHIMAALLDELLKKGKLLVVQQLLEGLEGFFNVALDENMFKTELERYQKEIKRSISANGIEDDLFSLGSKERMLLFIDKMLKKSDNRYTFFAHQNALDASVQKWGQKAYDRKGLLQKFIRKTALEEQTHSVDSLLVAIKNQISTAPDFTPLESLSTDLENYYKHFRKWRRNDYDKRKAILKWIYHLRDNIEKTYMRGSVLDQLADDYVQSKVADELLKSQNIQSPNLVPRHHWRLNHADITNLYAETGSGIEDYWANCLKDYHHRFEKYSIEKGYQHKFKKHIDYMFDLNKDKQGKIRRDKNSWRKGLFFLGKIVLAIGFAFLLASFFGFTTGWLLALHIFSVMSLWSIFAGIQGSIVFIAIMASVGAVLIMSGIVIIVKRYNYNISEERVSVKKSYNLPIALFLLGAIAVALPFFITPLLSVMLIPALGPGVSLGIMLVAGIAVLLAYQMKLKQKKGAGILMGFFIIVSLLTFSPLLFLGFMFIVFMIRYGVDQLVKQRSFFIGGIIFSSAIIFMFSLMFVVVPAVAVTSSIIVIGFYQALAGIVLVISLIYMIWRAVELPTHINKSNKRIFKDARAIKVLMDNPEANYQFASESIFPGKLINRAYLRRNFEDKLRLLRKRLYIRYSTAQAALDGLQEYITSEQESDPKKRKELNFLLSIVKLALLSRDRSGAEILFRNLDMEHRLDAPQIYELLDDRGKGDLMRKVEHRKKVRFSLSAYFRRYLEEHSEIIYFAMIFGIAFFLTMVFSSLIFFITGTIGTQIAQIVLTFVLAPLLFALLTTNASVYTDRWFSKMLPPRNNPEAEMPYGIRFANAVSFTPYNVVQGNQRKFDKESSPEEQKRGEFYGFNTMDEWFNTQQKTMRNNPEAMIFVESNSGRTNDEYQVYELMQVMRLADAFGWDNMFYTHVYHGWIKKAGKYQDNIAYLNGQFLDNEHYVQEMGLHGGRRGKTKKSSFDPEYRVQMKIGGAIDPHSKDPLDIQRKKFRDEMQREFLTAYERFQSTRDVNILKTLAKKYITDNIADKPSQMYRNNGVGMNIVSRETERRMISQDGRIGVVYLNGFDDDNLLPLNLHRNIFAPSHTRYMRKVGNQQPRTFISNDSDSVFAASTRYVHDMLQFTQQSMYRNFNAFSDYGKGSKIIPFWYLEIGSSHKMRQDTLSHDTQEAPGWFMHYRLHNMGFSMFNASIGVGEGTVPNYLAGSIRTGRWLFGTMQDMRNLDEPGSTRQKWISFLAIKGYWSEFLFFIYLVFGFIIVLVDVLFLSSTVFFPALILIAIFMISMYLIVFASKFKDLSLLPGGKKKNLHMSWEETKMSTAVYLNNPMTVSRYDVWQMDSMVQQSATGIPETPGWTPSAVTEEMTKSPTIKQTYLEMHWQIKLGLIAIFTLLFGVLFVPASGLVWATVLTYFFWAFPLYFSLIFGWYIAWQSGKDRGAFVRAYEKAIQESPRDFELGKVSSSVVDRAFEGAWQQSKWNEFSNSVMWSRGIYDRYGERIRDIRLFLDTLEISDPKKRQVEQERIRRKICSRAADKMNEKTLKFWRVIGVMLLLATLFCLIQALMLTGFGVLGSATIPILGTMGSLGLLMLVTGYLAKKSWTNRFNPRSHFKNSPKLSEDIAPTGWATLAQWIMVLAGAVLLTLGLISVIFSLGWLSGFMVPFSIIVGGIILIVTLVGSKRIEAERDTVTIFSKKGDKLLIAVRTFREQMKEKLWNSRNTPACKRERELLLKEFAHYDKERYEKISKEAFYQMFSDISKSLSEEEVKPFVHGTVLDEKHSEKTDFAWQWEILNRDSVGPVYVWHEMNRIVEQGVDHLQKLFEKDKNNPLIKDLEERSFSDILADLEQKRAPNPALTLTSGEMLQFEQILLLMKDFVSYLDAAPGEQVAFYRLVYDKLTVEEKRLAKKIKDLLLSSSNFDYNKVMTLFNEFVGVLGQQKFLSDEVRNDGAIKTALKLFVEESYIPALLDINEMKKNRQYNTPFGGILGTIFYDEFRDTEFSEKVMRYSDEVFKGFSRAGTSLNRYLDDITFEPNLYDSSSQLLMKFEGQLDPDNKMENSGASRRKLVNFLLDVMDQLDDGMFHHGRNLRQKISNIAQDDYSKLEMILKDAPMIQAPILLLKLKKQHEQYTHGHNQERLSFVDYLETMYFYNIPVAEFEQKKAELALLQRYPLLMMRLSFGDKAMNKNQEQMMRYNATVPHSFMTGHKSAIFALDAQTKYKDILDPIWKIADGAKTIQIFINYVNNFKIAHKDYFKRTPDQLVAFEKAIEELMRGGDAESHFYRKNVMGAKFSWVKGWRLPRTWNAISIWSVFKNLIYWTFMGLLGVVFAFAMFHTIGNIGVGFTILAMVSELMIGGVFFPVLAIFTVVTFYGVHMIVDNGYKLDGDEKRRYQLMGNDARKKATMKARLISLGILGVGITLLALVPSMGLYVLLGIFFVLFVAYNILYTLVLNHMENREQQHVLKGLHDLGSLKKGLADQQDTISQTVAKWMKMKVQPGTVKGVESTTLATNIDFTPEPTRNAQQGPVALQDRDLSRYSQKDGVYSASVQEMSMVGQTVYFQGKGWVPFVRKDLTEYPNLYRLVESYERYKASVLNAAAVTRVEDYFNGPLQVQYPDVSQSDLLGAFNADAYMVAMSQLNNDALTALVLELNRLSNVEEVADLELPLSRISWPFQSVTLEEALNKPGAQREDVIQLVHQRIALIQRMVNAVQKARTGQLDLSLTELPEQKHKPLYNIFFQSALGLNA